MAKGEEAVQKKRNKSERKRMRRGAAGSDDAARAVRATKRRQKLGKRRACEGMCFTLPTPEDPFNDRFDPRRRRKENSKSRRREVPALLEFETSTDIIHDMEFDANAGHERQPKRRRVQEEIKADVVRIASEFGESGKAKGENGAMNGRLKRGPSKLLDATVLDTREPSSGKEFEESIDDASLGEILEAGLLGEDFWPLTVMKKGLKMGMSKQGAVLGRQVLAALRTGVDVLCVSSLEWKCRFLGYVVPAAAHVKLQRINQSTLHMPLVLITVASQPQALQVRRLLKPLKKTLAIFSVSVHDRTSIETQRAGLRIRTPEVVVATPGRLVELVERKALCISTVSLLVVDGLNDIARTGCHSHMNKLKEHLPPGAQKIIISDRFPQDAITITRQLVSNSIFRALVDESEFVRSTACISQEVSVFTSVEKKRPKMLKILQQFKEKNTRNEKCGALVVVDTAETAKDLVPLIRNEGFVTAAISGPEDAKVDPVMKRFREGHVQALVTTEGGLSQVPISKVTLVIVYSFPSAMAVYRQILTGMARRSAHGELHSLCTASMASLARDLEEVLRCCSQEVPRPLQMLWEAVSVVKSGMP